MDTIENMKNEMKYLKDNIAEYECDENYRCQKCSNIEECYYLVIQRENSLYARSLDYGGYDIEEEFWEQVYKH